MNDRARWTPGILILVTCLATAAWADEITLKGGMTFEGTIVSETEHSLVLKLHSGGKTTLQKKMIESITRTAKKKPKAPATSSEEDARVGTFPPLGKAKKLKRDVLFYDLKVKGTRLWIYTPRKMAGRRPLVLIAPAGSRLIHGLRLVDGDRPEHLPYVRAGFCVVSYTLAGPVSEKGNDAQFIKSVQAFLAAGAGMGDAKLALDYALAKLPVDKDRVYAVGHSSAGTVALQFAAVDPRIKALAAFAPCTNIPKGMTKAWLRSVEAGGAKGVVAFSKEASPHALTAKIKVPVFLFQAKDDTTATLSDLTTFARQLKESNRDVTVSTVASGGHYQPMIDHGIPRALRWFQELP